MSKCTSCQAEIEWVVSIKSGKPMPLDKEPRPDGNVVIRNSRAHVLSANNPTQPEELRYVSHFSTCPSAAEHRK